MTTSTIDEEESTTPVPRKNSSTRSPMRTESTPYRTSAPVPPRLFDQCKSAVASPYSPVNSTTPLQRESATKQQITTPHLEGEIPDTTLGEGVVFKGELTFKRLLRIDGHFEGDLFSEGKLIVGKSGVVKSNIRMQEAIIEGRVKGNITVMERLELRKGAEVLGDIKATLLSVDEGVAIVGHVAITPNDSPYEALEE